MCESGKCRCLSGIQKDGVPYSLSCLGKCLWADEIGKMANDLRESSRRWLEQRGWKEILIRGRWFDRCCDFKKHHTAERQECDRTVTMLQGGQKTASDADLATLATGRFKWSSFSEEKLLGATKVKQRWKGDKCHHHKTGFQKNGKCENPLVPYVY